MEISIDRCYSLIKVVNEFLHLKKASIEVLRKHFEDSSDLVYNLIFIM